jgi:tRNA A-37 threonylcarbamoyl transferase component Bud32
MAAGRCQDSDVAAFDEPGPRSRAPIAPAAIPPTKGRHRRPTGAAPPLPKVIGWTGKLWLAAALLIVGSAALWLHLDTAPLDRIDAWFADAVTWTRSPPVNAVMQTINGATGRVVRGLVGLTMVGLLIWFRRWRHLIMFVVALAVLGFVSDGANQLAARPRPFDDLALAYWEGYSSPSLAIVALTAVLIGIAYTLVVPGRPRRTAKFVVAIIVAIAGLARIQLGLDHLTDIIFGAILGVAIPVAIFRAFVPQEAFPVVYGRKGKTAHLDVGGRRGEAIRHAVQDQLGLTIREMSLIGLEGSGGSTPLKLEVADEDGVERSMFAKLYAKNHVRADRWYKLGRYMLYGRMEDERSFQSVRRFVEYEDYALRLLGGYGLATPTPYGVVEITPELEYLIAMEFFENAVEIGEADVDEVIIDEGLQLIRRMWDVGIAHRDIKPANLMVQDGHLKVIDVFFVQVRPSPWRQAVDLANMMLVLALRSDTRTVYERALAFFSPDELAEAFAAARGVASPTQLRSMMKRDPRNLLKEFRALAPPRRPIAIQRWSFRRAGLILLTMAIFGLLIAFGWGVLFPDDRAVGEPACGTNRTMVLMAQAVPSAEQLPCVDVMPLGWYVISTSVIRHRATFVLGVSDLEPLVEVTLTPACADTNRGPSVTVIEGAGGCVRYTASAPEGAEPVPSFDPGDGLSFVSRASLVRFVDNESGLRVCGRGVPCP